MTTYYHCTIVCDRCGRSSNRFNGGPTRTGHAAKALARAKKDGWSRDVKSSFTDLCPSCLEESRRGA